MPLLEVRVITARNLPDVQLIGKIDPYVKVELERKHYKTEAIDNTENPKWDALFKFNVADDNSAQLKLSLWNKNIISDDFLGEYKMSLSGLTRGVEEEKWVLLQQCKSNAEINVKLLAVDFGKLPDASQSQESKSQVPAVSQPPPLQQQQPSYQQPPPQGSYPPQQPPPQGSYPPQQPPPQAYPPQQAYQQAPPPQGYPPQQPSYPPQQPGYAPQQTSYPPQQASYPPQQAAYPPQQPGYPPQQPGYPPQQPGYPPQQPGYPPQQSGW